MGLTDYDFNISSNCFENPPGPACSSWIPNPEMVTSPVHVRFSIQETTFLANNDDIVIGILILGSRFRCCFGQLAGSNSDELMSDSVH